LIPSVSAPPWTDLKSITAGGVDVTDTLLAIDSDLVNVVITLSDAVTATIEGTVAPPPGDSPEETFVRMFPSDRRFWQEPFGAFRRFPSARVADDGTYTIVRVPAGEYFIVAASGGLMDWAEAPQLELLARTAARATIANGEKRTVEVRR
jgi:hypothetical protein